MRVKFERGLNRSRGRTPVLGASWALTNVEDVVFKNGDSNIHFPTHMARLLSLMYHVFPKVAQCRHCLKGAPLHPVRFGSVLQTF